MGFPLCLESQIDADGEDQVHRFLTRGPGQGHRMGIEMAALLQTKLAPELSNFLLTGAQNGFEFLIG
jgi:hypothetical protein